MEKKIEIVKTRCICCSGKGYVLSKKRTKVTALQKKKIILMYRKGMGIREIQRSLKIEHPYSVTYAIKTANVI